MRQARHTCCKDFFAHPDLLRRNETQNLQQIRKTRTASRAERSVYSLALLQFVSINHD